MDNNKKKSKLIHIRLPKEMFKVAKMKCAYEDISMQKYVKKLVQSDVKDCDISSFKKK